MRDGVLFINSQPVPKKRIEDYTELADGGDGPAVSQYEETLPNGVTFRVLDTDSNGSADNTEEYVVPEGHYFMMGDNRDNSQDSRYLSFVGYVPIENFVGRADIIFFSISPDASLLEVWRWPFVIRWNRLFKTL
jgi:signal peptidase I